GVEVEAQRLEHVEDGDALELDIELALEGAVVARLSAVAGGGDERDERVAQLGEQRAQLGGREAGLEVVEQDVVGMVEAGEAGDVAVAQLDMVRERRAERL